LEENVKFLMLRPPSLPCSLNPHSRDRVYRGNDEGGGRPLIGNALQSQGAVVSGRDTAGNRETQPGAAHFTRARLVRPVESLAKMGQMLRGDADTSISHPQNDVLIARFHLNDNLTTLLVVLDGIVEQDQCRFAQEHLIAQHQSRSVRSVDFQRYLMLFRQRVGPANERLRDLFHIHNIPLDGLLAGIQPGQRQ
jgi:hypothetical protein